MNRPNADTFVNPQSRYARQLLFKGAKELFTLHLNAEKSKNLAKLNKSIENKNHGDIIKII